MVKEKQIIRFECRLCGLDYETYSEAEICERLHEDGKLRKIYLHVSYNLSEICDEYDLTTDEGNLVLSAMDEIETLIRIKDGKLEVMGIDGKCVDKSKFYNIEEIR